MDFREIKEFFNDTFKYIILIVVVIVVSLYIVGISQVVGPSMEPTHQDGEVMIISKMHYSFTDVKQNDVVAYESEGVRLLIKRTIALPGQTIEYKDNYLYIDGNKYQETLYDDIVTENFKLFVIPDNLYPSNTVKTESDYGIISNDKVLYFIGDSVYQDDVQGIDVDALELYVIQENFYFMMGDNRGNSQDSRELGLVNIDDIDGKIIFTMWPLNKFGSV